MPFGFEAAMVAAVHERIPHYGHIKLRVPMFRY
jgi:hypothetical protein